MVVPLLKLALVASVCVVGALVAEQQFDQNSLAAQKRKRLLDYASEKAEAAATYAREAEDLAGVERAAEVHKDVTLLRGTEESGWTSAEEAAAARRVIFFCTGRYVEDATDFVLNEWEGFVKDVGRTLNETFGWIFEKPKKLA